jgi:hypothetical protein
LRILIFAMEQATWLRQRESIKMSNWRHVYLGVQDDSLKIGGVAVWHNSWRRTADPAVVLPHPSYAKQLHRFSVLEIGSLDQPIRFAVAELSPGVYGFYVPS